MKKLQLLRDYLLQSPALDLKAAQLHIAVKQGEFLSRSGCHGLRFVTPVEVLISDFKGRPEVVGYLLAEWLNRYQPERDESIPFEADLLNHDSVDLLFILPLAHSLLPVPTDDGVRLYFRDELPAEAPYSGPVELYLKHDKIAEWHCQAPAPSATDTPDQYTLPDPAGG